MTDGKRIFLVEDNPANSAVARTILERFGHITFFDRWGDTSLERFKHSLPIDLVLMDLMLPDGVSGYVIFDLIRGIPGCEKIPIVLVTAADAAREMNNARNRGFNGFIAKPIKIHTFPQYVGEILAGKQVWVSQS